MNVTDSVFFKEYVKIANDGWLKGWHERNGGNLSYRMTADDVDSVKECFTENREWKDIGTEVPELAGEYFTVTGSGKFFRNISLAPSENAGIIEIDSTGCRYRVVWGLENGARPTSELPTHLMNHEVKKIATGGRNRVIYHAHPANVIALTFVLPLDSSAFSRELWESATECPIVFPAGVGVVPWMVPGGKDIAVETSKLMTEFDAVVWAHHGLFCAGETLDIAFGLMDTVEKSAEILVKVKSMSGAKLNTIHADDFKALAKAFGVDLNENYLN